MELKDKAQNEQLSSKNIKNIIIEDVKYTYLISKLENKDSVSIILKEIKPNKNINFIYEASSDKLTKDIKQLCICENLDEKITILKEMIETGKIIVERKEKKYFMIIETSIFKKISKYEIELIKQEPIDERKELLLKLKDIDAKYRDIKEELNKLKNQSILNKEDKKKIIKEIKEDLNINECIKEVLKDKEIKDILFKEFEERLSNIYIKKDEKKADNKLFNENIEKSINKIIDNKYIPFENKFNENFNKIKENIINNIKEINNIKDNYITLKIKINKEDINKDIIIINQCSTYKLFKNFELDDINIYINNQLIPIKYKNIIYDDRLCRFDSKSIDSEIAQKIYNEINNNYSFYYNFSTEGVYNIKIIFKKQLSSCAGMFFRCKNMIEIDLSKFDCSKILSCDCMFYNCKNIINIELGKLNFSFVNSFRCMFNGCNNLINLDVTNINTKNSKSFRQMFRDCNNLKKIDVSKFDSSECETIYAMFECCSNLEEIDMLNWDMSNFKYENEDKKNPIEWLFNKCYKLKRIKISGNIKKEEVYKDLKGNIFKNISLNGELIMNKKVECNIPLEGYLPPNWIIKK